MRKFYMQSVKSPVKGNKFKLQFDPKNSNSMIFSQAVETDVSDYEEDSFCVRNNKDQEVTPVKKRTKKGPRRILPVVLSSDDEKSIIEPSKECHKFTRPKDLPLPSKVSVNIKSNESSSWLSKLSSSDVKSTTCSVSSSLNLKSPTNVYDHGRENFRNSLYQPSCSSAKSSYIVEDNIQVLKHFSKTKI